MTQWIDLIWLPLMMVILHRDQRLIGAGFFIACAVMMRMEIELMVSTGFVTGMLPLLDSHIHYRGLTVFSIAYAIYLGLCVYSPTARGSIMMAASITVFFAASIVSILVMLL